jgi:hypothetical protein
MARCSRRCSRRPGRPGNIPNPTRSARATSRGGMPSTSGSVGYVVAGLPGAVMGTIGISCPRSSSSPC